MNFFDEEHRLPFCKDYICRDTKMAQKILCRLRIHDKSVFFTRIILSLIEIYSILFIINNSLILKSFSLSLPLNQYLKKKNICHS